MQQVTDSGDILVLTLILAVDWTWILEHPQLKVICVFVAQGVGFVGLDEALNVGDMHRGQDIDPKQAPNSVETAVCKLTYEHKTGQGSRGPRRGIVLSLLSPGHDCQLSLSVTIG
jgi:hypothetical protein